MSMGRITYLQSARGSSSGSRVELAFFWLLFPSVTICIALVLSIQHYQRRSRWVYNIMTLDLYPLKFDLHHVQNYDCDFQAGLGQKERNPLLNFPIA